MIRLLLAGSTLVLVLSANAQVSSAPSLIPFQQNSQSAETSAMALGSMPPAQSESEPRCTASVPTAVQNAPGQPPNGPSAYVPLSTHCKFALFLRQTYSPYTFVSAAYEASWAQLWGQWPQYGGGMQGWGKRFGATLANTESRRFIQGFVLSTVLHQDPRYFPSGRKRLEVQRAWYAATRVVVTKSDEGRSEFNTSELLGALATSSLQNAYYPEHYRTFGNTMSRFAGALGSDATADLLHEFAPDLKRIFRKHAPKKIKELEQKIPLPPAYKP